MTFNDNKAIYLQIADSICDDILLGAKTPGSPIPSVRELSARLEVNANTVMRSYSFLEEKGVLTKHRGIGFSISDNAVETTARLRREQFFNEEIDYFLTRLKTIGITPDELKTIYTNHLNKQ